MVESRKDAVPVPEGRSVFPPRSSNRTCRFPASGFPTEFTPGPRRAGFAQGASRRVRRISVATETVACPWSNADAESAGSSAPASRRSGSQSGRPEPRFHSRSTAAIRAIARSDVHIPPARAPSLWAGAAHKSAPSIAGCSSSKAVPPDRVGRRFTSTGCRTCTL